MNTETRTDLNVGHFLIHIVNSLIGGIGIGLVIGGKFKSALILIVIIVLLEIVRRVVYGIDDMKITEYD